MWNYLLSDSEFSCLVKLAKPYPVSGPTYRAQILNLLHCIPSPAHEVLITIFGLGPLLAFTLKGFALCINALYLLLHCLPAAHLWNQIILTSFDLLIWCSLFLDYLKKEKML